jgi:O-acetyl-ADP-ribose deacetylase (regulator of RNase III)
MKYTNGNLLDAATQAYVNTVNTVGVMGKGIALQFREAFPVNYKLYVDACKNGEVRTGKMFVVKEETMQGPKIIVNFPTKREWFAKSKYEYIEEGLKDLVRVLGEDNIQSIAIPPLGCGNGGLKWDKVKSLMEQYLGPIRETEIYIYEPTDAIKEILKAKESTKSAHLTDARALLLYAL